MGTMDEVLKAEAKRIAQRRAEAVRLGYPEADQPAETTGLALSGGGIRAAFVARGLIEELAGRQKLSRFDYMSSVSGGGYAACALTDHVGNLKKNVRFDNVGNLKKNAMFDHDAYKLKAPPYRWWRIILGMAWDPVLNVLPLLAYLSLFGILPASKGQGATGSVVALGLVLLLLLLAVTVTSLYRKFNQQGRYAEKALQNRQLALVALSFLVPLTITIALSSPVMALVAIVGMWASELFVSSRPHRYYKTANPAFRWFFIALLGVFSGFFGGLVVQAGNAAILAVMLIAALAALPAFFSLNRYNKLNLIFTAYRAAISERFLPFSTWLTHRRRLHDTQQSWNPYPILNASVTTESRLEPFELAPLYSGSSVTGFHPTCDWLPEISLSDAMAISGGAVDFLRRTGTLRSLLGTLFGGTEYWVPSTGKAGGQAIVSIKRMEAAVGFAGGAAVRLSDGGFVDNLGVLALIKRRVMHIVCLDASYDPEYRFDDLRRLCVQIQNDGLGLLSIGGIASAGEERRFRQNTSNILRGTIAYPATAHRPAENGVFLLLKISPARLPVQPRYPNFPHLTTLDQLLHTEEIAALHELGRALADELCSQERY